MPLTVPDLITMCERRVVYLQSVRTSATALGDLEQVSRVDAELAETQDTLNKLRSLPE